MALTLALSYTERNDNKLLTIVDSTANYGVDGNIAVTAVTSATLDITITTSDGTITTYDQIDLVDLFGDSVGAEFNTQAAMSYAITAAVLKVSGTAMGTTTTLLPDGIWGITYTVNTTNTLTEDVLVDGQVRNAVYELLRALPTIYNCDEHKTKQIQDALYCKALLDVMESDAYAAMSEELLDQLFVLQRLVTNGSSYTW